MNSSSEKQGRTLANIPGDQLKDFLYELVNLMDGSEAVERFETRYAQFLPWANSEGQTVVIDSIDFGDASSGSQMVRTGYDPLFLLRDQLREIWATADLETKEWRIFLFRGDLTMTGSFLVATGPPPPSPFQQAVLYLLKHAAETRRCHNADCSSPYFFARRISQKYCSEDCARPAQRRYKRQWWQRHGGVWRQKRVHKSKHKNRK